MLTQLEQLVTLASERSKKHGKAKVAIVHPCNSLALECADVISKSTFAEPVLFGNTQLIAQVAQQTDVNWRQYTHVDTDKNPAVATHSAIMHVHSGDVDVLMKGSLHTDELMSAVVDKANNMRGSMRMSHVFLFALPTYHKLLGLTDCVINITPNLKTKTDIISNAIALFGNIGVARPKVAIVSAVETVNPAIEATLDAQQLVALSKQGKWGNALVEGPFGFDNAFSQKAAVIKGIDSQVSGDADVMLLPDLNAANILYKSCVYVGQSDCAGVVLGARTPIVITSRADSVCSRLYSVALATLAIEKRL